MESKPDLCMTCFSANENGFGIFTARGEELEAYAIIRQHFGFEIVETDVHTQFICWKCWRRVEDFHELYKSAEEFHSNYMSIQSETEIDPIPVDNEYILEDQLDSNDKNISETEMKPEPMASISLDFYDNFTDSIKLEEDIDYNLDSAPENVADAANSVSDPKNDPILVTVNPPPSLEQKKCASKRNFRHDEIMRQLAQYNKLDMSCDLCVASFASFKEIQAHYKSKHNYRFGYLKCCGQRLKTPIQVKDHVEWHRDPNIFKCQHCDKVFSSRYNLNRHAVAHEPETNRKFECTKCDKTFLRKYTLNQHCRRKHTKISGRSWKCDICKKTFAKYRTMQHHIINIHVRVSRQPCKFCGEKVAIGRELRKHMQSKHEIYEDSKAANSVASGAAIIRQLTQYKKLDLKCDFCEATVQSLYEARAHYKKEHNYIHGHVKCCGHRLKTLNEVKDHVEWHLDPNIFKCQHCAKVFGTRSNLKLHIALHEPETNREFECPKCDKMFSKKFKLNAHCRKVHPEIDKFSWKCDICKKTFAKYRTIHDHIINTHVGHDNVTRQLAQYNKLDMSCDLCVASFESFKEIRAHYKTKHNRYGHVKCCGQRLRTPNEVNDHVDWHRDPNIFKCQHCVKVFSSRNNLRLHAIHHEPETNRKFKCTKCDKTFFRKSRLTQHRRLKHTKIGNCSLECDICKKIFATYQSMQYHIIYTHVRVLRQPCKLCGEKVAIKSGMRRHMQSKHTTYEDSNTAMIGQLAQYKKLDLKCDRCEATFLSLYEARAHYKKKHNYKHGYIKCCGNRLTQPSYIAGHIEWHQDPNIFNCQECGKTFDDKHKFSTHQSKHARNA